MRLVPESLGLGEVQVGLGVVAFLSVRAAPVVVRLRILRVDPDGLGVVGDGLVVVALLTIGIASGSARQKTLGRSG